MILIYKNIMHTTSQVCCIFRNDFNFTRIWDIYNNNTIFSIWSTFSTYNADSSIFRYFNIIYSPCINLYTINLYNIWRICNIPEVCCSISSPCSSYSIISTINTFKYPKIRCVFITYKSSSNLYNISFHISFKYFKCLTICDITNWSSN